MNCLAAPFVADVEVTEAADVAKGDAAVAVETVAANAVIDLRLSRRRRGFETSMESVQGRAAVEGSVGTLLFVDGAEGKSFKVWWKRSTLPQVWGDLEVATWGGSSSVWATCAEHVLPFSHQIRSGSLRGGSL